MLPGHNVMSISSEFKEDAFILLLLFSVHFNIIFAQMFKINLRVLVHV